LDFSDRGSGRDEEPSGEIIRLIPDPFIEVELKKSGARDKPELTNARGYLPQASYNF
jgi:hypothetical protein